MAVALTAATLVTSCSDPVGGRPVLAHDTADQSFFFAGDVPTYGRQVSDVDVADLAYLRALRRIDVCGLVTGDTLASVGQLISVGTLFAFDECDAELKISGVSERRLVSVELEISATASSGCQVSVPLPLNALPGAAPQPDRVQPTVRVELIGADDCGLTRRIADALAERLGSQPLPPRDGAVTYPSQLAERDPCEVLARLDDVASWDVAGSGPYRCRLRTRAGAVGVRLQPHVVDNGPAACSAVSFVGGPMRRRVIGVGYVDPADVVIRPAVVVDSDELDCGAVAGIATQAARLYG